MTAARQAINSAPGWLGWLPFGFWPRFAFLILVFSVTRGLIPLLTGMAAIAEPVYALAALLGAVVSAYGVYLSVMQPSALVPPALRVLLQLNLVFHLIWLAPIVLLKPDPGAIAGFLYTGLFPFSIIAFLTLPARLLMLTCGGFTLLITGTVLWDFVEMNSFWNPDLLKKAVERHQLLRSNFDTLTNNSGYYRPIGLFGHRPHDAAIFLGILSAYWLQTLVTQQKHRLLIYVMFFTAATGMLLTQVATHILAFIVGATFMAACNPRPFFRATSLPFAITGTILVAPLLYVFYTLDIPLDILLRWQERLSSEGDWEGFTNLDFYTPSMDFFSLLFGHGQTLAMSRLADSSEFAILQMFLEFGLVQCTVLLCVFGYPIWMFLASRRRDKVLALPFVGIIVISLVSLWHYASILHTTSVFLLFAFYAQALKVLAGPLAHPESGARRGA